MILHNELRSLCVQYGIEEAVDDVAGALLDPGMVRAGRGVEMDYFKSMRVYDRVPRADQVATGARSSARSGST